MTVATHPAAEELRQLYLTEQLSARQIARQCGVTHRSILVWLRGAGISRRGNRLPSFDPGPALLRSLYWREGLDLDAIGERYGVNHVTVLNAMKRYGMSRRSQKPLVPRNFSASGPANPFYGRHHTVETKRKISNNRERGLKISAYWKGRKRPELSERNRCPEMREKLRQARLRDWSNPEYARKMVASYHVKPTKPERIALDFIEHHGLPYRYNADTADTVVGRRIPDFVRTDGVLGVLEVFGEPFHQPSPYLSPEKAVRRGEAATIRDYADHGYDCIVIWSKQMSDEQLKQRLLGRK